MTSFDLTPLAVRRLAVAGTVAAGCLLLSHGAQAAPGCAFDPATRAVTVSADATTDSTTIKVVDHAIEVTFDGPYGQTVRCGGATTATTDSITAIDAGATVIFDASDGDFAPGFTPEATGASEIELAARGSDTVGYVASLTDPLDVSAGTDGLSLDGDDDVDLTYGNATSLAVTGSKVGGAITAQGGHGAGAPLPRGITFAYSSVRGATHDDVTGHAGIDQVDVWNAASGTVSVLGGDDQVIAGAGQYVLDGGNGDDMLSGSGKGTTITGGAGDDYLQLGQGATGYGGRGADFFDAADGRAEAIDGGAGVDVANVDAALDTVAEVESVNPS